MGRPSFNPNECIILLNNVKMGMQMTKRPFSKESIINCLRNCGLPTNNIFWSVFRNSGILQEVSKNQFLFTFKEPIYVGFLNLIKIEYNNKRIQYNMQR